MGKKIGETENKISSDFSPIIYSTYTFFSPVFISMDDFTISNLHSSRDEWCARLVSILTPLTIEGIKSIFNEALKLANDNNEGGKYLMTFQNLLCRVPKWNGTMIEEERQRIIERSGCGYLEDLITCVHIIQLKTLTCIRVGNKQKKIDISIPKLDLFLHKVYVHLARKCYKNVYLFESGISPLAQQKNMRELEVIAQECILSAIRESVPTEQIIKAYLDESMEQEEEVIIEPIANGEEEEEQEEKKKTEEEENEETKEAYVMPAEEAPPAIVPSIVDLDPNEGPTRLTFNDVDKAIDIYNEESAVMAPKDVDRLERISEARHLQRKMEEEEDDADRIKIGDDISLDDLGIMDIMGTSNPSTKPKDDDFGLIFDELPPL
jgi:hypothetical protein